MNSELEIEVQLDSFDAAERRQALKALHAAFGNELPEAGTNVNMHYHSSFSFNAEDWSPSHIAWEARKAGLYAAGLCDFDVLDGLEEFLEAGRMLELRTTVNLETRVYLGEFAGGDITSPGEPGVTYIMGAGFARELPDGSPQAEEREAYRQRARARNEALLARINPALPDIAIDYEADVLPLTPGGNATERHIVRAYAMKARRVFEHPRATAAFWAGILDKSEEETVELLVNRPSLEDAIRARLVKRGGVGYEQPSEDTFPPADDFIKWVLSCDAVPMITWLDGTSPGESRPEELLECQRAKGAAALNIIPDRNWNIKDPQTRALKIGKLNEIVELANRMQLPVNIGTEMNKQGLPFVDSLEAEALAPHRETFLRGARIMVGHTLLQRYAGMSYTGDAAASEFGSVEEKNDFFERVGGLPALTEHDAAELEQMGVQSALGRFREKLR